MKGKSREVICTPNNKYLGEAKKQEVAIEMQAKRKVKRCGTSDKEPRKKRSQRMLSKMNNKEKKRREAIDSKSRIDEKQRKLVIKSRKQGKKVSFNISEYEKKKRNIDKRK